MMMNGIMFIYLLFVFIDIYIFIYIIRREKKTKFILQNNEVWFKYKISYKLGKIHASVAIGLCNPHERNDHNLEVSYQFLHLQIPEKVTKKY